MKAILKHVTLCLLLLSLCLSSKAQAGYRHYNVDSLLKKISKDPWIRETIKEAGSIYKHAGLSKDNISANAFTIAFLEKSFLDSQRIRVTLPKDSVNLPYQNPGIITVVDYTKDGKHKRFATIDLIKRKLIHSSLVSHGSGGGVNDLKGIPVFFGNADSSYRSSLGLVLAIKGDQPDNLCHLCKDFIRKPHKCVVILAGLESGINDRDMDREIVIHTTGSKDFSDSTSTATISDMLHLPPDSIRGLKKKDCGCILGAKTVSSYASACAIADNKGFIGRSSGCFVLPEETHIPVMEAIQDGSLIFVYSNAIAPTSTNYFETSPVIMEIIRYAAGK